MGRTQAMGSRATVKPYYEQDGIMIYHGDCREILPSLPKVDCLITDPPYGFGAYASDNRDGVVVCLQPWKRKAVFGYPEVLCGVSAVWGPPDEWVTWWPTNKFGHSAKALPRDSEAIAIYGALYEMPMRKREADSATIKIAKAQGNIVGSDTAMAREGDVWRDAAPGIGFNARLRRHPNEKPESLMLKLVRLCSQAGETVLDPYVGSGTTLRAAKDSGRKAIGIEIEERYCEIAASRLSQQVLGLEAVA